MCPPKFVIRGPASQIDIKDGRTRPLFDRCEKTISGGGINSQSRQFGRQRDWAQIELIPNSVHFSKSLASNDDIRWFFLRRSKKAAERVAVLASGQTAGFVIYEVAVDWLAIAGRKCSIRPSGNVGFDIATSSHQMLHDVHLHGVVGIDLAADFGVDLVPVLADARLEKT